METQQLKYQMNCPCRGRPLLWQHWGHDRVPAASRHQILLALHHATRLWGKRPHSAISCTQSDSLHAASLLDLSALSAVDSLLPRDAKQPHLGLRLPARVLGHCRGQPAHLPAARVHPGVRLDLTVQGEWVDVSLADLSGDSTSYVWKVCRVV